MKSALKSYIRLKTKPLSKDTKNEQRTEQTELEFSDQNLQKKELSSLSLSGRKLSIGDYLQEARVNSGQTIHQVSQITKIHTHYLEAVEREDFANTPPSIYVRAYIKRLCDLYKIDQNTVLTMYDSHIGEKGSDTKIPENLVKDLENTKQPDSKQEEKIKSYIKYGSIGLISIAVVIIIITLIFSFTGGSSIEDKPLTTEEQSQLSANMEKFFSPQTLDAVALKTDIKK